MENTFFGKIMDVVTLGGFSKKKAEMESTLQKEKEEEKRKAVFEDKQVQGEVLRRTATSEISEETKELLVNISKKANKDGTFNYGTLTWGDLYVFSRTASQLQGRGLESFVKDEEVFVKSASGEMSTTSETPIEMDYNMPGLRPNYVLGGVKVGVVMNRPKEGSGNVFTTEFTLFPSIPEDKTSCDTAAMIYGKIADTGLPMRDTTGEFESYKKYQQP